ncbi:MAG TPA: septum formation initiator family protein [Candidatus Binatia bacterium]
MMPFRFSLPERWLIYLFGALIILLALITVIGERGVLHLWRLRGEKNRLDEQNFHLQKENETLRQRVYRIRNDNAYLEKVAREELNLVRPGEIVYRFSNAPNRSTDQKPDSRAGKKPRGAIGEKPKP